MASYTIPPVYAAFIWWFSTGAVLLLVGCARRFVWLQVAIAAFLVAGSLCGLAFSAGDASIGGAYIAFTSTILLWGAQEIAFLSGWVTGPRPEPCPVGCHRVETPRPGARGDPLSRVDATCMWRGGRRVDLE